jgi:hypothetical protein
MINKGILKGFDKGERLLQPLAALIATKDVLHNADFVFRWQSAHQILFQDLLREMRIPNALKCGWRHASSSRGSVEEIW